MAKPGQVRPDHHPQQTLLSENALASNVLGFYSFKDRTNGLGMALKKPTTICWRVHPNRFTCPDPQKIQAPGRSAGCDRVLTIDREINPWPSAS